ILANGGKWNKMAASGRACQNYGALQSASSRPLRSTRPLTYCPWGRCKMRWSVRGQELPSANVVRLLMSLTAITWLSSMNVHQAAETRPSTSFLPGSDWPMYRHDPELTAASPLRGGLGE